MGKTLYYGPFETLKQANKRKEILNSLGYSPRIQREKDGWYVIASKTT